MDTRPTTEDRGRPNSPDPSPAPREVKKGITLPPKLSELRSKLGQKAKQQPKFRFYALDDRVFRPDVLATAWQLVQKNDGAAGVDGVSCQDIVDGPGVDAFLQGLHEDLRTRSYRPQPVKRVQIPKPDDRMRPLGIPTVRDRVVQTAVLLVIEPIFEADFLDSSFGFRPGRNAHQAIDAIRQQLAAGLGEVYDADLHAYFDTIPHDRLMACLEVRISDRSVLKLIRMWLCASVIETDDHGRPTTSRPKLGTPHRAELTPPTMLRNRRSSPTLSFPGRGCGHGTGKDGSPDSTPIPGRPTAAPQGRRRRHEHRSRPLETRSSRHPTARILAPSEPVNHVCL